MSQDSSPASGPRPAAPDPFATAAVIQSIFRRAVGPQPVSPQGDELELLEYALSAWDEVDMGDAMHFQALTFLVTGLLPILVLADLVQLADPSQGVGWLATFNAATVQAWLERSGTAAWCQSMGYPLERSGLPLETASPHDVRTLDDALAMIRDTVQRPDATTELEAHDLLDSAVRDALPIGRDLVERVRALEEFSSSDLAALRMASWRLLLACRLTGSVVAPAIAWEGSDEEGLEGWATYAFLACLLGLNLRLLADTSSPAERTARLHLDDEDLDELAEAVSRSNLGHG